MRLPSENWQLLKMSRLLVCGMLACSNTALAGDLFRTLVKDREPPCAFSPAVGLASTEFEAYDLVNVTSAAWFARSVQLVDGLRQQTWQRLAVPPVRVEEFSLKSFGLHASLLEFDDHVLFLYRGTEDALDYVLNGTFFTVNGEKHGLPGWVHEGFLINFNLTWNRIRSALKDVAQRGKKIVFASHSLGGVLSQYAAWRLEAEGIHVHRLYAFQSPNAGDLEFKRAFDARFAGRASNTIFGEDVTPHIPPVLESADAFASAVPKPLSRVMNSILSRLRYGAPLDRFTITSTGEYSSLPADQIAKAEIQYWNEYQAKSGGKPFPLGLGAESPFVKDHDIDKVLCSLVKSVESGAQVTAP